jgi:isoleucyl-tRNA synthetase
MAPILTFTTEEAWKVLPGQRAESVHLERFPDVPGEWLDDRLERDWTRLLQVRRDVSKALETARAQGLIGSGLEAAVSLTLPAGETGDLTRSRAALLPTLFIVSQVDLDTNGGTSPIVHRSEDIDGLVVRVGRARGTKCARCWVWSERVGEAEDHPMLCERCVPVVRRLGFRG